MSDAAPHMTVVPPDVVELQAENQSLRDRLLRALAEAENTRRRADRAAGDARRNALAEFARELLAVADNLRRAIAAAEGPAEAGDATLREGVRATERMLEVGFERFGIHRIEALGQKFDPQRHEAVMEVADTEHEPGTVLRVAEDGYMIGDRLLRPARVVVAKRPSDQQPAGQHSNGQQSNGQPSNGQQG
jgi:molecular chaperone GrpE